MHFRTCIAIIVLSLTATFAALAQNGGKIQLSGSVVSVTRESKSFWFATGASDPKSAYREEKIDYFAVHLYLQFRNLTDRPLLIIRPGYAAPVKISFLDPGKPSLEDVPLIDWLSSRRMPGYDPLSNYIKSFAEAEPSRGMTVRIEPFNYYETQVTIETDKGYLAEKREGRSPADSYIVVIPEYRQLKLKYFLSTKKRPEEADLLSAQQKWKKFGELVLNSDGDYSVESDIILNKPDPPSL